MCPYIIDILHSSVLRNLQNDICSRLSPKVAIINFSPHCMGTLLRLGTFSSPPEPRLSWSLCFDQKNVVPSHLLELSSLDLERTGSFCFPPFKNKPNHSETPMLQGSKGCEQPQKAVSSPSSALPPSRGKPSHASEPACSLL